MLRLPLTLKVRRITRTAQHVEVEALIVDADGTSVRALPITTGRRSAAEVASILQSAVDGLAKSLHSQGHAALDARATEEETELDFEALAKREFTGSVAT